MSLFRAMTARVYAVVIFIQLTMMQLRERTLKALCAFVISLLPGIAFAAGDLADMVDSLADGASRGKTSGLVIAQAIGVVIFIASVLAFKKIGKQPQVTLGTCLLGLGVGALLLVVPELMGRTNKQMGTNSITIN
ncbi:DUF6750 family protein [Pectobacterium atrosepticum]|uniref:DUF6750 family protein n=1 Tax=Pectobacterium atrosepticum TaxID=29471 RepID=UPI003019EE06